MISLASCDFCRSADMLRHRLALELGPQLAEVLGQQRQRRQHFPNILWHDVKWLKWQMIWKRYERYWKILKILKMLKDIERYWKILKDIEDIERYWKILKDIERYWKILKDTRYWKILKDTERYWKMLTCWNMLKYVEIGGRWITWITWITWAWLRSLRTKGYESTRVCTIRFLGWCNICFLTYVVWSMRGQVCNILRPLITSWRRTSMETIPSPSQSKNEITASWQRAQANNSSWHVWTQSSKADGAGNHVRIEASSAIQSSHVAIWFSVLSTGAC